MSAKYGLRIGVIAIPHTFTGKLEFNSHVHTMVTGGGYGSTNAWVPRVYYDRNQLMKSWRKAVISLLRAALKAGQLHTEMNNEEIETMLSKWESRWWSIKIKSRKDKGHFLQYAGRYGRPRPSRSIVSPMLGTDPSGFGTSIKSCIAGLRWSAPLKSSLTAGHNTFQNTISMRCGALGCLLPARSGRPRQPSLSS